VKKTKFLIPIIIFLAGFVVGFKGNVLLGSGNQKDANIYFYIGFFMFGLAALILTIFLKRKS
jgi:hypothetical protein